MLKTIMVPLDGSEFARRALPRAVSLARRAGSSLLLVRVHEGFPPADPGEAPRSLVEADREREEREREQLASAADRLRGEGLEVETAFEEAPIGEALRRRAEASADLVVMCTHGRGGFSRFWLGSVADELARTCGVPLLFVRPEGDGGTGPVEAAALEQVLVPLDGTEASALVLDDATRLGGLYGARYTLVRVLAPVVPPGYGYEGRPEGAYAEAMEVLEETAAGELEATAAELRDGGHRVDTAVVRHASVAKAVVEAADGRDADLIAMTTHGRGGVERMVLGSVADKVLRASARPVLLRRPDAAP